MPEISIERLYDEHADALFGFLLNLTRHEADTRDLLQALFIKLARNPEVLSGVSNERSYLLRIAHRLFIDLVRRRDAGDRAIARVVEAGWQPEVFDPDPGMCVEEKRLVEIAVASLPEDQRAAVHLRIWEELTFEEIAAVTGASKATAVSRYRYGLQKLRSSLSKPLPCTGRQS